MPSVQVKRGTRAQLETAKAASGLLAGEPYLITDEARLAVGTAANAYSDAALKSEVDAKLPLIANQIEIGAALVDDDVVAVYDASATAHRKSLMSRVWTYISGKITGAISGVLTSNLTASLALVSDGSGKLAASSVTSTELGYLSGVTSAIQTQLNAKAPTVNPVFPGAVNSCGVIYNLYYHNGGWRYINGANPYYNSYALLNDSGRVYFCIAPQGTGNPDDLAPVSIAFSINPATGAVYIATLVDDASGAKLQVAGSVSLWYGGVYKVNNKQVVGARGASVADATNSTDVITQLNALLSRLRTHGLIET